MHHCSSVLIKNSHTMVKSCDLEFSTMVRLFLIGTSDLGATRMVQNTWRFTPYTTVQKFKCEIVAPQSKVPILNFWPLCDYFLSQLLNNNVWRNPPGFLYCFSCTMVESSKSEFILYFCPYCDYFLSELLNSGTCGNLPGCLYHFSRNTVKSSKLELWL